MKSDDGLILILKYTSEDDCLFCQKYGRLPIIKINFAPLLNRALYTKYSQSSWKGKKFEDFFSTKSIKWVIQFKDKLTYDDQDEFLKRYYPKSDQQNKLDQLLEYYKYHKDIPRMFLPKLSDLAIYFYEKKKQLEYRKIKIMLGIPIDDASNYTECEKLKEEIKVLNSITQQTQVSSLSLLRDMLKQKGSEEIVNIDATWITMANHQQTKSSQSSNLKLLKQLISKNTQFYKHKLNTNYTGLSKRNTQNSPQQNIHLKTLSKDTSQKSLLSSHKLINNSNGDSEFQKFLKQQMVGINHSNPCNQNNVKSITKPIQISNYQSKQNSIHHLISTRSISSEQLKLIQSQQILKPNHHTNNINQQSQHKKSQTQTHYTEINSPNKHNKQASNKLYTNIGLDFKQALTHTKSTDKLFKVYTSQSSIPLSTNINININQLNMNNLNIKSSFQQYKAMLESPKVNPKKKTQSNVETQRIHNASTQKSTTSFKKSQISVQQIYAQKIKQKHKIQNK